MPSPSLADWVARLDALGHDPKPTTTGYQSRCPAHEDREPSLSLSAGTKQAVVAKCHAGCDFHAIRAAMNWPANGLKLRSPSRITKPKPPPEPVRLPHGPGVTVTAYRLAEGTPVLAIVRKQNGDRKRITQWTPAGGGLWIPKAMPAPRPLLGLPDVLGARKVLVVEGEKCATAARKAWPEMCVTTWCGGTQAWELTDWEPLATKTVTLLADADDTGRKAMRAIAERLEALHCTVRLALPEGDTGEDVADWLERDGVAAAAERIKALLPQPEAPPQDEMIRNEHYEILGLVGDFVAIRIAAGRILQRTRESMMQVNTLLAIAPDPTWWAEMCHGTMGAGHARIKGAQIVNSADKLGQIDMTSIYGRGAARLPDGEIVWHLGDRLLRDGRELPLNGQEQVWLAEPPVRLTDSAGDREILAARDAVMDYRWNTDDDGRRFLGWLVCALVGGALDWRPHLLLTAPAGQGKSWLLKKVIEPLYGPLLLRIADGTEASVARATQASSLPLVVDEAEPSSGWVMKLMTLLRVAAGGEGKRLRSDLGSSSGVTFQNPRFSALLSATSVPVMSAADSTRISLCNLGHAVSDWGAVSRGIETAMAQGGRIRSRLIRDTPAIVGKAKAITDRLIVERAGSSKRQHLI